MLAEETITTQARSFACPEMDNLSSLVSFLGYCDKKKNLTEAAVGRRGSWWLTLSGDTGCLCGEGGATWVVGACSLAWTIHKMRKQRLTPNH